MTKYCDVKPILHLLADKDLLDTVNVGAVLQALQHGLYNGEVAPVVHAHWNFHYYDSGYKVTMTCSACGGSMDSDAMDISDYVRCPCCGAKMDEKEGNL